MIRSSFMWEDPSLMIHLGGCVARKDARSDADGLMMSNLAARASWNVTDPPIALHAGRER